VRWSCLVASGFFLVACDIESRNQHFRDLNKNGRLDVYEDQSQPVEGRVTDILGRMTVAEKEPD
jgi:hypothetical protein